MLNVSYQALQVTLESSGRTAGHVTTYFTDSSYSVSPDVEAAADEPWDAFISRIFERVDYQLSLW